MHRVILRVPLSSPRSDMVGMNNSGDFVLGIDLGGTKMALGTANAEGAILHRRTLPTQAVKGAMEAMERVGEAALNLVGETALESGGRLVAVGVASMGVTLETEVLMAPNVPGWHALALPTMLRQWFPETELHIENDVKAAAWGEVRWGALAGIDSGIYLNLGTGIAAALVVRGHVVRGAHGAAGEIAYNLRHLHEEAGTRQGHTPLEEYAGGGAIGERATRQFGRPYTTEQIFEAAATDAEARAFVEATLTEIAYHVTNLTIALDPERVVVSGGLLGRRTWCCRD